MALGTGGSGGCVQPARKFLSEPCDPAVPAATDGALARPPRFAHLSPFVDACTPPRQTRRGPASSIRGQYRVTTAHAGGAPLMIFVVHAPETTRSALLIRVLTVLTLTWLLGGAPGGTAVADACAYASVGPGGDGTGAVAVAGDDCPSPPPPTPCPTPKPTPTPAPSPTPKPPPKPKPTPTPTPKPKPPPPPPPAPTPRPATTAPRPAPAVVPAPTPPPRPTPTPKAPPRAGPEPSSPSVSYPPYRPSAHRHTPPSGPSMVSLTLLLTVPAVFAVAALRPR